MFKPVNENHSILEVHFVLETERPWLQEDKAVIEQGDKMWGDVLPGNPKDSNFFCNLVRRFREWVSNILRSKCRH